MDDPYLTPGDVLRNRLGITDSAQLQQAEGEYSTIRLYELQQRSLLENYDLKDLQTVHYFIFQDVYDWAGKLRTIPLSKREYEDRGLISHFTVPRQLVEHGNLILTRIGKPMDFRNRSTQDMANHLGEICKYLNTLHPFREGNGRALRAFMFDFVKNAGKFLSFEGISRERWIRASIQAHHGDNAMLIRIFSEILDTEAHRRFQAIKPTFDKMRNDGAWDWHDYYISVPPPGATVDGTAAIITDDIIVVRTGEGRIELIRPDSIRYTPQVKDHIVMIEPERAPE